MKKTVIAIDFDGTITKPGCGDLFVLNPGCKDGILELEKLGFELILWTCRYGASLEIAMDFLKENDLLCCFAGVNQNSSQIKDTYDPRKIVADIYIDDRNFGGLPSWHEIVSSIRKKYCPTVLSKSNFLADGIITEIVFESKIRPLFEETGTKIVE